MLTATPVTFGSFEDEGRLNSRSNRILRERRHDNELLKEMKALKRYIIAAQVEGWYENKLYMHKSYYPDIWD